MNPSALVVASVLAQEKQQGSLLSFLPLLVIGALFIYLFTVQPRKQKQRHADFVNSLAPDDEVVTSGGIHGTINVVDDDVVHLKVDSNTVIRVSKASLARKQSDPPDPKDRRGAGATDS